MNSALACALLCTLRPLKWSVTPEVAGSSPVAPVSEPLHAGGFRLTSARRRVEAMGRGWGDGDPGRSGKKRERFDVRGPDDGEVPAVERRHVRFTEPLGRRNDRRV